MNSRDITFLTLVIDYAIFTGSEVKSLIITVIVGDRKFFKNQNFTGFLVFFITVNIMILEERN